MPKFSDLGINPDILKALDDMGFEEPTPIQEQAIPHALAGRDLVGLAQTGTGKTTAFGIPLIDQVTYKKPGSMGIVLTPTRELAIQIAEELNRMGKHSGAHSLPIYGGQDIGMQIRALKRMPRIIVATPGRLMDHMDRKTITLDRISMVVLDEADEMLNMGFIEDVEKILKDVPEERQTLLFCATMPKAIQGLTSRFLKDPETISIIEREVTVPLVEQYYVEVRENQKFDTICRLIDIQSPELCIIFGRTKLRVDELTEGLNKRGYAAEGIHGDLTQSRRDAVLRQFRNGRTPIMVATGVAARGIDITGVTHVYNFDMPQDLEGYVHRIGRTGRAGQTGSSVTFVTPREIEHLMNIERVTHRKIVRMAIPTATEAVEGQQRVAIDRLLRAVEEGNFDEYRGRAEELLMSGDSVTLLSAALKLLTRESSTEPVRLTEVAPLPYRSRFGGPRRDGFRPPDRRRPYPRPHSGQMRPHAPGDRPFGDRPPGDRPTFGDRPQGDRPYGDRPYGDRPYGERKFGDRPYGDRRHGDRTERGGPRGGYRHPKP